MATGMPGGQRRNNNKEKSMKFRSFIIVLLALLMVFAFASCKRDPGDDGKDPEQVIDDPSVLDLYPWKNYTPTSDTVYEIEIVDGVAAKYYSNDKLKLVFGETIQAAGDVLTLKYRSERSIYQWDIRDGSMKWVYEKNKNGFEDPVLGEGGWYTLTYTFGETDINGAEITYPYTNGFGVFFRGNFVAEDSFEIMDITLTHTNGSGEKEVTEIEVDDSTITSSAELVDTITDHVWEKPRTYAVLLSTGALGDADEYPVVFKYNAGDKIDFNEVSAAGIDEVYFDVEKTQPYYRSWKVIEDGLVLYYEGE